MSDRTAKNYVSVSEWPTVRERSYLRYGAKTGRIPAKFATPKRRNVSRTFVDRAAAEAFLAKRRNRDVYDSMASTIDNLKVGQLLTFTDSRPSVTFIKYRARLNGFSIRVIQAVHALYVLRVQ